MPTQKRKKSDEMRKQQTRKRLLLAGSQVFEELGFHKPRISDIVSRANVGQGTFYRHFASKRELFETLYDELQAQLLLQFQAMSENLPRNMDQYRQASIQALKKLSKILVQEKNLVLLFLRHGQSVDEEFSKKMHRTFDGFAGLAKLYLDHAMEMGFVRECDSETVSQALVGIGLRFVDNWLGGTLDSEDLDRVIDQIVDFAFFGFAGQEEKSNE